MKSNENPNYPSVSRSVHGVGEPINILVRGKMYAYQREIQNVIADILSEYNQEIDSGSAYNIMTERVLEMDQKGDFIEQKSGVDADDFHIAVNADHFKVRDFIDRLDTAERLKQQGKLLNYGERKALKKTQDAETQKIEREAGYEAEVASQAKESEISAQEMYTKLQMALVYVSSFVNANYEDMKAMPEPPKAKLDYVRSLIDAAYDFQIRLTQHFDETDEEFGEDEKIKSLGFWTKEMFAQIIGSALIKQKYVDEIKEAIVLLNEYLSIPRGSIISPLNQKMQAFMRQNPQIKTMKQQADSGKNPFAMWNSESTEN